MLLLYFALAVERIANVPRGEIFSSNLFFFSTEKRNLYIHVACTAPTSMS